MTAAHHYRKWAGSALIGGGVYFLAFMVVRAIV